ncbi:DUF3152 domain-containing protein [Streptomyces sp. NPDC046939]|uniref:DUF3152 domain-containing protein n=1 Tax=Streptomyces sp. NPDC046939 TaxID=3155376 RepID=UPI0033D071D4
MAEAPAAAVRTGEPRDSGVPGPVRPGTGRRRKVPAEPPTGPATPAHASAAPEVPRGRGGHPEQREPGGGWGAPGAGRNVGRPAGAPIVPRPRQEYVDAFDKGSGKAVPKTAAGSRGASQGPPKDPYASVTDWDDKAPTPSGAGPVPEKKSGPDGGGEREKRGRGFTYTGIAAAAVTTVLAVVVAGQVTDKDGGAAGDARAQAADGPRVHSGSASRSDDRPTPSQTAQAAPATYAQKMSKKYPLAANLKGPGDFETVPGSDKAPGHGGDHVLYRVDVEKGLGLDGELFAQAVQKTLNDRRSWAHDGAYTFERVSKGKPRFVITLASPGTTAAWCAKSGLDTTEDNVSCDSAATDRVMINAYRWAQGSKTYDDVLHDQAIYPYRQMLINHEVGHRLGHNHVNCSQKGALAPVMQQQTKSLSSDGITCKPNPWVYPRID